MYFRTASGRTASGRSSSGRAPKRKGRQQKAAVYKLPVGTSTLFVGYCSRSHGPTGESRAASENHTRTSNTGSNWALRCEGTKNK